ncbi:MAG: NTP transferase domain-containing protein [Lewinella sp.]|nr:NTP transferase domain-containing protein [Lewinella sp.]
MHQKHTALARPAYGEFHRHEWAFIGAPCGRIQELTARLIRALAQEYQLAYVDADHAAADAAETLTVPGAQEVLTDKINFHRYDFARPREKFQRRPLFHEIDGVLLNGNHFQAKRQIVILDPKKEDSLRRKLDRLTDVALILSTDEQRQPYDFLSDHLAGRLPAIMPLGDINGIIQWLRAQLTAARPPLYGLVLAGGKSTRMGEDKGLIDYHGRPQREYLYELLGQATKEVYYSLAPDQAADGLGDHLIRDTFTGLGPYGAILSAFRQQPDAAWLVVACDLPLLDREALQALIQARDTSRIATAFHNAETGWPDPLITIWEPRAYPQMLQFLAQGFSCPRKVLINTDAKVIEPANDHWLRNANDPAERAAIMQLLK